MVELKVGRTVEWMAVGKDNCWVAWMVEWTVAWRDVMMVACWVN